MTAVLGVAVLLLTLMVGALCEPPLSSPKPLHDRVLLPLAGVCFTLLVALASGRLVNPRGRSGTFKRLMVWFGDRSYSMYLFHFPVMALGWWSVVVFTPWLFYINPLWYGAAQAVFTFALTILLADLTYRYVELPWNDRGGAISQRMTRVRGVTEQRSLVR